MPKLLEIGLADVSQEYDPIVLRSIMKDIEDALNRKIFLKK